ncbi:tRNA lysidine(34) synthetase TilS [Methylophaga sp.]|uniref:tRNA lysidine(34) synthetase TilS n=1 Tax=Methylophaga sp. TaxID=2024840 RepID=UPI003F69726A
MAFNPQQVIVDLIKSVADRSICIAYSGGVDSHVLLHLLASSNHPQLSGIRAIHIDHGLQDDSAQWAKHCATVASDLGIQFESIKASVENINDLGTEAAARQARYQSFEEALSDNEVLLTAQHQHDQAETLMLQLLRGAGPTGLSGMKTESKLHDLTIIRPLLRLSKADILEYAELHQLDWIDDPSNIDLNYNRNYLRHKIFPELEKRWPAADKTLSRSADHCREAAELIQELARLDAENVCINRHDEISISALTQLTQARQRNVLRFAIEQSALPLPSTVILQRVIDEICMAAADKTPHVHWTGAEIRRYRDTLLIQAEPRTHAEQHEQILNNTADIELVDGRRLKWQQRSGEGLKENVVKSPLLLKFREGGEKIRLQGHSQHKSLKQLFQEWGVPHWKRGTIPLIFVDHELVAVVGYGYAEHYAADIGEKGWLPYLEQAQ